VFASLLVLLHGEAPLTYVSESFAIRVQESREEEGLIVLAAFNPKTSRLLWSRNVENTGAYFTSEVVPALAGGHGWVVLSMASNKTNVEVFRCTREKAEHVFSDVSVNVPRTSVGALGLRLTLLDSSNVQQTDPERILNEPWSVTIK
jgi:hypothetical protein